MIQIYNNDHEIKTGRATIVGYFLLKTINISSRQSNGTLIY